MNTLYRKRDFVDGIIVAYLLTLKWEDYPKLSTVQDEHNGHLKSEEEGTSVSKRVVAKRKALTQQDEHSTLLVLKTKGAGHKRGRWSLAENNARRVEPQSYTTGN